MARNRALASGDPDLLDYAQELSTQKRSVHTIKNYSLQVNKFHEWLQREHGRDVPLRSATAADLKQYQIHLVSKENLSKNTLYITIKALQSFYRHIELDVADGLKPPRRSQSLPKYLSEAEAHSLLLASVGRPRDHVVIQLLLYGGFRVGEVVRLGVQDFDFFDRTVRIRSGKGDKDRIVIISKTVVDAVRQWLERRPKTADDFLFPGQANRGHISTMTVQRIVGRAARDAGIAKTVTPHVLRHTLATTLLRRGGDIRFIQRILGHASIATTQVYTHLDDAELKRMYDRAAPDY